MPVALKDNIAVRGVEMTAGTSHRSGVVAEEDAPVYTRLRDAGAVLLGKLSMSEWAIGATNQNIHFGDVHNPWDSDAGQRWLQRQARGRRSAPISRPRPSAPTPAGPCGSRLRSTAAAA